MRIFSQSWLLLLLSLLLGCTSLPKPVKKPDDPAVQRLVNMREQNPGLRFDIRYATPTNFTGRQLYPMPAAWLHRDTARALRLVQRDLEKDGLGLKVFDAYRPFHIQQLMWNLVRDERYVSNPAKNAGRHTRGTAVDVTLVDRQGRELMMPTAFDDFTERAHRDAPGIPRKAQENSTKLARAMVRHGFVPYPYEWWHFDYRGWEQHPPLDVSLSELGAKQTISRDVTR